MEKQEECEHEFELRKSGYSYEKDSGRVYWFGRVKCKKCEKTKVIKQFNLNIRGNYEKICTSW